MDETFSSFFHSSFIAFHASFFVLHVSFFMSHFSCFIYLVFSISQVWDLGGQTSIRPYWRCYYPNTDAIIFVVDSCDSERLGIAKQELLAMLEVSKTTK